MNRKIFLISLPALAFSVHRLSAATRPFVYDTATGNAPSVDRLYRDFYIYVDMSPSPAYRNTSDGKHTITNDFYYKDSDGTLKQTVSKSGAEKNTIPTMISIRLFSGGRTSRSRSSTSGATRFISPPRLRCKIKR